MTAPEEAVMGFAAEETVLTLEAAALFWAALLTASLAEVLLSVVVVDRGRAIAQKSVVPLTVTSALTTNWEESLVSSVGLEMTIPAALSMLFMEATASLAALRATLASVVPLMVLAALAATAFRESMLA